MNISVVICDDLEEDRFTLSRALQHYAAGHRLELSLDTVSSGGELLARWAPGKWDVAFLDIYMPGLSGVDIARQLRECDPDCALIFVTTSQDHGLVGYDLQIADYLVKPFGQPEVNSVLDWLLQNRHDQIRTLRFHSDWEAVEVRLRDISYIEVQQHTALIHTGSRVFSTRRGIDSLEAEIHAEQFFRCHRSFLVNLEHVVDIQKRDFRMDDGTLVPISLQNLPRARQACLNWSLTKNWGR